MLRNMLCISIIDVIGMVPISDDDWYKVFDMYMKEIDAQEKLKLLKGLASSNNILLLNM